MAVEFTQRSRTWGSLQPFAMVKAEHLLLQLLRSLSWDLRNLSTKEELCSSPLSGKLKVPWSQSEVLILEWTLTPEIALEETNQWTPPAESLTWGQALQIGSSDKVSRLCFCCYWS